MLDPKNKGPPVCNCPDCKKKIKTSTQTQPKSQSQPSLNNKKEKKNSKKSTDTKSSNNSVKKSNKREKIDVTKRDTSKVEIFNSSDSGEIRNSACDNWKSTSESNNPSPSEHLVDALIDTNKSYTMWIEVKKRLNTKASNRNCRSSSEHSSQDYGYSSEHNVSSSSLPSTPEGSEVACSDGCCNREVDGIDSRAAEKLTNSDSSISILREHGGGLTLSQMLEVRF